MDKFINVSLRTTNLDTYYIRTSIFNALTNTLPQFKGNLLDIGCGKMPYKNYILKNSSITEYAGLDIEDAIIYDSSVSPDFTWDGVKMPFQDNTFQSSFGTEVLEHCPAPEIVLSEVVRVLKPGGVFFFSVPFLWNLHEVPHDEYRYTPFSLERHLKNAGFVDISIKATGGWHASLAQMLGLWVRRAPISKTKKRYFSYFLKPIIKKLIAKDMPVKKFKNGQMITGLYGTAIKPLL